MHIFISFSESNGAQSKPKKKSKNWERMDWWDEEIIVQEETSEEVDSQENLHVNHTSECLMAIPSIPLPNWLLFIVLTPKVILFQAHFLDAP